ncbi:MAG: hypothetical protein IKV41_06850 [Oscillospiraceae bacterium]|nr:hypothetical protein [Oscillospiraceae bacterium]
MIKCESCGKTYNFDITETCPRCGAFNTVDRQRGTLIRTTSTTHTIKRSKMLEENPRQTAKNTAQQSLNKSRSIGEIIKIIAIIYIILSVIGNFSGY